MNFGDFCIISSHSVSFKMSRELHKVMGKNPKTNHLMWTIHQTSCKILMVWWLRVSKQDFQNTLETTYWSKCSDLHQRSRRQFLKVSQRIIITSNLNISQTSSPPKRVFKANHRVAEPSWAVPLPAERSCYPDWLSFCASELLLWLPWCFTAWSFFHVLWAKCSYLQFFGE